MSEHRHRRRRRTSGFDLARLYENEDEVLNRCAREHRQGVVGWAAVVSAGLFGLLLVWMVMSPSISVNDNRHTSGAPWTATPAVGPTYQYFPPDSMVEECTIPGLGVVFLLIMFGTLVISGIHLALGQGESSGGGGNGLSESPVTEALVAEPSAFERRLDELVCIKISRRPQTRRHRGHR